MLLTGKNLSINKDHTSLSLAGANVGFTIVLIRFQFLPDDKNTFRFGCLSSICNGKY